MQIYGACNICDDEDAKRTDEPLLWRVPGALSSSSRTTPRSSSETCPRPPLKTLPGYRPRPQPYLRACSRRIICRGKKGDRFETVFRSGKRTAHGDAALVCISKTSYSLLKKFRLRMFSRSKTDSWMTWRKVRTHYLSIQDKESRICSRLCFIYLIIFADTGRNFHKLFLPIFFYRTIFWHPFLEVHVP